MLSSSYLASCSDDIVKIYAQLEHDIIIDMARRLKRLGRTTDATQRQAQVLAEIGALRNDVSKRLARYDRQVQKQLLATFDEAMKKAAANDMRMVKAAKRNMSASQKQLLEATAGKTEVGQAGGDAKTAAEAAHGGAIKTFGNLSRLTMTIADTAQSDFISAANGAYMQAASGAFSYQDALKNAVNELAAKGVHTVEYTGSGKTIHRSIESAVRMNVLTGINQAASRQTLDNAAALDVELFEVSAHVGARPEHEAWQGKIYTADELRTVCGLGEVDGLCGINCRHSYYPYIPGTKLLYSNGELDEMKDASVRYNGKEMTRYEAEQKLRGVERAVRKYKLQADALGEIGEDNTAARIKLGQWQAQAREFCRQTGIRRDYAREYVGTDGGKQGA
ncbi:MAG: hypothetical protein J6N15_00115 [Ruminiclostridium sp.]|nr:hypothetical protein [Ruminiclostridium sp.]